MEHRTVALPAGTYEQAKAMIGTRSGRRYAEGPVNPAMIKYFCCAVEDGNPSYWDEEFATKQWGAIIAPPAMLVHWLLPAPWHPGERSGGELTPLVLRTQVPLPGDTIINVGVDYQYLRPVRVGDRLSMVEELTGVSELKTTRLGVGHFVDTRTTYYNQHDDVVGIENNTLYRFSARRPVHAHASSERPSPPVAHDRIPGPSLAIDLRRMVLNVGACWDLFPGHYDPIYAQSNGHQSAFANTTLILSFADRIVTDWAGPRAWISRRKLTMSRPVYLGDVMSGHGAVLARRRTDQRDLTDVVIHIETQRGVCATATATVELVNPLDE